jgi:hypothetical protein
MINNKINSQHVINSQMHLSEYYDEEVYMMVLKESFEDFLMFDYRMYIEMMD